MIIIIILTASYIGDDVRIVYSLANTMRSFSVTDGRTDGRTDKGILGVGWHIEIASQISRWLIWWLTAPAQTSRVRRNAFECNSEEKEVEEEECTDVSTISSLNLPSGPKLAWLLRRLAQTAEDFANFDNLPETEEYGFENSLLSSRKQEKRRTLHDFRPKLNAMNNIWTDDIDFHLL